MPKPELTRRQLRRRRSTLRWVPSVVIVAVIALVVGISVVVAQQGIGQSSTLPPAVGPRGYSTFDAAGLKYISDTRTVWVDLRVRPLLTDSLGLASDGTVTIAPREGVPNYLGLYGNGIAVKIAVDSIQVTSQRSAVIGIDATSSGKLQFAELEQQLTQAEAYGISARQVSTFLDQARTLNRSGSTYTRTLGPGAALGVPITAVVTCAADATCGVEYRIDLLVQ